MGEEDKKYVKGLVSIVIPTYRRSNTLKRAIRSVLNQTYSQIEILVVDDNEPGSEYSEKVCELVKKIDHKNVRLITQPKHINGAAARNAGIRAAAGEYISFLDDDDLLMPEKIAKQVKFIKTLDLPVGGVSTRKLYYHDGKITSVSEKWCADSKQNYKVLSKQQNLQTCTLLLRHDCLDDAGYFDERLRRHQEVQLMSFFTHKYRVEYMDEFLTIIDSSDVSNRPSAEKLAEFKRVFYDAVAPITSQYSKHKQKLILAHNNTELAYAMYRDGDKKKGLLLLARCLLFPSVLVSFVKRIIEKIKNKKGISLISQVELDRIDRYIRDCQMGSEIR